MNRKRGSNTKESNWKRNCPKCNRELFYFDKRNLTRALQNNSVCMECKNIFTDEYKKKISESLKKNKTRIISTGKRTKYSQWSRNCPECNEQIFYARKDHLLRAITSKSICNSCSCKIYKKSWNYVIKEDHIKKMAAKKAGYDSFETYMNDLSSKKKYYREVRKITNKQDIGVLENYDKLRGKCGIDNAYQLDHIISISSGYDQNISPEVIGHITNLQIIPWKDNLLKGSS